MSTTALPPLMLLGVGLLVLLALWADLWRRRRAKKTRSVKQLDQNLAGPVPPTRGQGLDYRCVIADAVSDLASNTPAARQALYDRARASVADQVTGWDAAAARAELAALEAAIDKVERASPPALPGPHIRSKAPFRASRPPPEPEVTFREIDRLMDDETAQIDWLPEPFRSKVLDGAGCDEITRAAGEFGRDPRNPIPVNGPLGEVIYLSNLRLASAQQIMFHCLGSVGKVAAYETVSLDGAVWDILYLDPYHPRKSRRAPIGYRIAQDGEREKLLLGANELVANFPGELPDA